MIRRTTAAAAVIVAGLALPSAASADVVDPATTQTGAEAAEQQAALVAGEDRRLTEVRAVTAVAPTRGAGWSKPYRLDTGDGYTLVLTQQRQPYSIADLLKLAPQTFTRESDGSYLLTENLYLNAGAKLRLANPGGLNLRMASNANGFVSIVSFGGGLTVEGTPQAPTRITSWDPRTGTTDTRVDDGRAYIRAIGGQFSMTYAQVENLGFWSGRTGGVSLTGTDRPDTGNVTGPAHLTKTERHEAKAKRLSEDASATAAPGAGGVFAQPSGALSAPDTRFDVPGLSYVSGNIDHSTITGDAFGLFVSSANGITVTDTTVEKSLYDGVVLHRFASSAALERVVSRGNGRDGIVLSRAAQQVRVSGSIAEANGGNGFTVDGQPLASDASVSGEFVGSYGNNSIANSQARHNRHYGIEVIGGLNIGIQNNTVVGSDMGIVAREGADTVTISGNQVSGQTRHGIALHGGVTHGLITGNVITAVDNAIYLRDAGAEIRGNTVAEATNHGIALVGDTDGTSVKYNVIAGVGPSALDASRTGSDIEVAENQIGAWHDTSSFWIKFRHYFSPMTMLWTAIVALIVISALIGMRRRRTGLRNPYANTASLAPAESRELASTGSSR